MTIKTCKVKKSGNTYMHTPKKPATLPMPQQVLLSEFAVITQDSFGNDVVRKSMHERELKVLFFLLHAVFDELEPGKTHELEMEKIHKTLYEQYGIRNESNVWIWDAVETLAAFRLKWVENHGDERWDHVGSLISHAKTNAKARRSGTLQFRFCDELVPVLKEQSRFSRMRLHFLMSLSGKYSIILYGILEGFANQRLSNKLSVSLDDLKSWLKIDDGEYEKYSHFKSRVIESSLKQINSDSDRSGLSVSYTEKKKGRKVVVLEFIVNKSKQRQKFENEAKYRLRRETELNTKFKDIPQDQKPLDMEKLGNILIKNKISEDKYSLKEQYETEWRQWLHKTGRSEDVISQEASFYGFLRAKLSR
jgi:plasmid replication initiation protein